MILETLKLAAFEALCLLPREVWRDDFITAIIEEKSYPICKIQKVFQWMTTSTSRPDEEWWEESHCIEISYMFDVLHFTAYWNNANVVGAGQRSQYWIASNKPFDGEQETNLQKWSELWREFLSIGKPTVSLVYDPSPPKRRGSY